MPLIIIEIPLEKSPFSIILVSGIAIEIRKRKRRTDRDRDRQRETGRGRERHITLRIH